MKLIDLEPRWVSISRWDSADGTQHYYDTPPRRGGISFNCPVHLGKCSCCGQFLPNTHRLVVFFANPVDGLPPQVTDFLWQRAGDAFETLTISPSIDAAKHVVDGVACWHGFITDGDVR